MPKDVFDFAHKWVRKGKMTDSRSITKSTNLTTAQARQKAAIRAARAQAIRSQVAPSYRAYEAMANHAARQAQYAVMAASQAATIIEDKK